MNLIAAVGAALRFAFYVGLLAGVGAVVIRALARRLAPTRTELLPALERRAGRLGAAALLVALAATVLRLPVQLLELHMPGEPFDPTLIPMLLGTTWGDAWMAQVGTAILTAVALWWGSRRAAAEGVWMFAAVGAVALVASVGISGHAAEGEGSLRIVLFLSHVVHAGTAALWIGTLTMLVCAAVPAATEVLSPSERGGWLLALLHRFSPLALGAAAVLAVSGVAAAVVHVGTFPALWESDYGRLLLVKLALALTVVLLGAYHWRRAPALVTDDVRSFTRTAGAELAMAVLVVAVTAILVATPLPIGG